MEIYPPRSNWLIGRLLFLSTLLFPKESWYWPEPLCCFLKEEVFFWYVLILKLNVMTLSYQVLSCIYKALLLTWCGFCLANVEPVSVSSAATWCSSYGHAGGIHLCSFFFPSRCQSCSSGTLQILSCQWNSVGAIIHVVPFLFAKLHAPCALSVWYNVKREVYLPCNVSCRCL